MSATETPGRPELRVWPSTTVTPRSAQLLARCREGDAAAWRDFYDAHFEFVYRVARRLGAPPAEAEDVVHDVFLVAFRRLDQFESGRISTWLYRITANMVSDLHRKRRVRATFAAMAHWVGGQGPAHPARVAEERDAVDAVDRVLQRMGPKKREVFALFELEGLSGEEIAERVGCPVGTVWTRLYHARKEFLRIAKRLRVLDPELEP